MMPTNCHSWVCRSHLRSGASPYLYASTSTQWFIAILFTTCDSRMANKLCGRKTTKQNDFTLWIQSWLLSFCLTSCVVELGLTGLTSTSRSSRTTCAKSLALLRSSDSVLSVRPRILWSWVRKSRGSSLSRLVRTTASSPLRLTCEPSSPLNAFSHILLFHLVRENI